MIDSSDFWEYDENKEKENGVYWEFVNIPIEKLETQIYYPNVFKIICQIKNPDLKEKMRNKLYHIFMEQGILFNGATFIISKELFSEEQIEALIRFEIAERGLKKIIQTKSINTVLDNIELLFQMDNNELIYKEINKIFDALNQDKSAPKLQEKNVRIIYYVYRRNSELGNRLLKEKQSKISKELIKYLEIRNDKEYLKRKSLQFMEKNILIGIDPRISIGPEIEADNDINIIIYIQDQIGYEEFKENIEPTIPIGTEIACPPLHDTPSDVAKLCVLLEAMKETGFYYDEKQQNAAGQINIGLDYLNTTKSVINFFEIFTNCEELLFYISNKEGQLTRQSVYINSRFKAISEIIGNRVIDEDITRNELLELLYVPFNPSGKSIEGLRYKKDTVGVRDLYSKDKARLEIRIPNGSTEYQVWLDNIRLYGKIVEISRKLAEIEMKDEITESEEKVLWLKEDLKDPRNTLEDKLNILMDLLFKDDNIKQIYINRFQTLKQKIKETGTDKYQDTIDRHEPAFGKVDFEKLYNSARKREEISYDPKTGIYIENGKEELLDDEER